MFLRCEGVSACELTVIKDLDMRGSYDLLDQLRLFFIVNFSDSLIIIKFIGFELSGLSMKLESRCINGKLSFNLKIRRYTPEAIEIIDLLSLLRSRCL